ncbi:MAG TPA: ROK family protein [Bacteroidota bacterium]|jgi:glucokinase|nr:ROK family protein [Bacteroidota bacterium]
MPKKTFAIGIDLGGTSIKTGVVDKKGKILDQISVDSKASKGPPSVIQQMIFTIQHMFGKYKETECMGIGIGSPGVISVNEGLVKNPPNFANWDEVSLSKAIRKATDLPIFVENDANVAAIAEANFGAGAEYKHFLYVIWGTGVGGGIIVDKKIYRGPYGGAGEIGHVSIDYNGPVCNCGNHGCIEAYIGQRYLSQRTKEILKSQPKDMPPSKIIDFVDGNLDKIDPYIISMAAEQDDRIAREILEEAGKLLGYALVSVLNVIDVRVVVIGGGISAAPHYVYKAMESALRSRILKPNKAAVRILRAQLGNSAGMIGAASLVM